MQSCTKCSLVKAQMDNSEKKDIQASIIIPTYNRGKIIKKVIESLSNQSYPPDKYELIVVDDGSTDNTEEVIRSIHTPCNLRYFRRKKEGIASARNYGIKKAKGEIIIFVDSDVVVNRDFVKEHVHSHSKGDGIIVRGVVISTETIDKLGKEKKKLTDISTAFFATGNVSIRKKYLLKVGLFDEDFKEYGWEDLELGVRLKKEGLKVVTNKKAVGYHYKKKPKLDDIPAILEKERMRGRMAAVFYRKHPTLEVRLMTHISPFFFALDRLLNLGDWIDKYWSRNTSLQVKRVSSNLISRFFIKIMSSHFYMKGVKEALEDEGARLQDKKIRKKVT